MRGRRRGRRTRPGRHSAAAVANRCPRADAAQRGRAGSLTNYAITNTGATFTINARPATGTTNAATNTCGSTDLNPLTTGSGDLLAADGVTATYSRAAGETVLGGPYHITATLGPAGVLTNYAITNTGASFTINARPATWTTNANRKKIGKRRVGQEARGRGALREGDGRAGES